MPDGSPAKGVFWLAAVAGLAADQATKLCIYERLSESREVTVIPGLFYLRASQNTGVVWGLFNSRPFIVTILTAVAAGVVIYFFHRYASRSRLEAAAWGMILGGAAGNLLDRIVFTHVRDFLDFRVSGWAWPTFNVADACITIGAVLLLVMYIRTGAPEGEKAAK